MLTLQSLKRLHGGDDNEKTPSLVDNRTITEFNNPWPDSGLLNLKGDKRVGDGGDDNEDMILSSSLGHGADGNGRRKSDAAVQKMQAKYMRDFHIFSKRGSTARRKWIDKRRKLQRRKEKAAKDAMHQRFQKPPLSRAAGSRPTSASTTRSGMSSRPSSASSIMSAKSTGSTKEFEADLESALECFQKAVDIYEDGVLPERRNVSYRIGALQNLGVALLDAGRPFQSLKYFEKGV